MKDIDTAKLRALAEAAIDGTEWHGNSGVTGHSARDFIAAASPLTVVVLLDELDEALMRVDGYSSVCEESENDNDRLREQLAAMTAARDEAVEIAKRWISVDSPRDRLSELRRVGEK